MTLTHQPWIDLDVFLSTGSYTKLIVNPTEKSLVPYVQYINTLKSLPVMPDKNTYEFCDIALYCLTEAISPKYLNLNPQLYITFDGNDILRSIIMSYEFIDDNNEPSVWLEGWASDGTLGAQNTVIYFFTDTADRANRNFYCNPSTTKPGISNVLKEREPTSPLKKDSDTKWLKVTPAQMQSFAAALSNDVESTDNFSKLWVPIFASTKILAFDYGTKAWVEPSPSVTPIPPFQKDTWYQYNQTKVWEIV